MRTFSQQAYEWLSNYHGSIDSTALLMAYDAGAKTTVRDLQPGDRVICIDNKGSLELNVGQVYVCDSWPVDGIMRISPDPSPGGWEYAVDRFKLQ